MYIYFFPLTYFWKLIIKKQQSSSSTFWFLLCRFPEIICFIFLRSLTLFCPPITITWYFNFRCIVLTHYYSSLVLSSSLPPLLCMCMTYMYVIYIHIYMHIHRNVLYMYIHTHSLIHIIICNNIVQFCYIAEFPLFPEIMKFKNKVS